MKFMNKEHRNFYTEKMSKVSRLDSYNRSLIYLLSMNDDTRRHFNEIYDIDKNEINIKSLKSPWQTSTS